MNKYNKNKIAITLLSALACSANTSAKDFGIKNSENLPVKTSDFSTNKNLKLDVKSPQTLDKLGDVAHINSKTGNSILKKFNKLNITMPVLLFSSGTFCTLILNEIFNKDFNIRSLIKSKINLNFIYKKLNGDKDAIKAFEYLKNNIKIFYSSDIVDSFAIFKDQNKKLIYRNNRISEGLVTKNGIFTVDKESEVGAQEFEKLKKEYNISGEGCYLRNLEEMFAGKCYLNNFKLECSTDKAMGSGSEMKTFKFTFFLGNNKTYEVALQKVASKIVILYSSFIYGNMKKTINYDFILQTSQKKA